MYRLEWPSILDNQVSTAIAEKRNQDQSARNRPCRTMADFDLGVYPELSRIDSVAYGSHDVVFQLVSVVKLELVANLNEIASF